MFDIINYVNMRNNALAKGNQHRAKLAQLLIDQELNIVADRFYRGRPYKKGTRTIYLVPTIDKYRVKPVWMP